MADKTWKKNERGIAGRLNGRRVPVTGRQRGDAPDVDHPHLAIECKHRKSVPAWLTDAMDQAKASAAGTTKLPIAVIHEHGKRRNGDLVVMTLADFVERFAAIESNSTLQTCEAAGAFGTGVSADTENPHNTNFPVVLVGGVTMDEREPPPVRYVVPTKVRS